MNVAILDDNDIIQKVIVIEDDTQFVETSKAKKCPNGLWLGDNINDTSKIKPESDYVELPYSTDISLSDLDMAETLAELDMRISTLEERE